MTWKTYLVSSILSAIANCKLSGSIRGLFELSGKAILGLSYLKCVLKVYDSVF